ncbi:MAG: PilZ domain-containing protein [Treponema sp.]|nr:PilZ domain-containing protein [Treponema sp.]
MKLLLVLGSDDNFDIVSSSIPPLGFEIIRYRYVMKAMDNLDEISPSAIVVSARDFPRHWKILVQFVRSERSREACPIILLKGGTFSTEETAKAFFLGVNGVLDDALESPEKLNRLQNILGRHVPVHEKRKHHRYLVEPWHRVGFLVANFSGKGIVQGTVQNISAGGLSFMPANCQPPEEPPEEASVNEAFKECSLRVGDAILSPVCRLVRTGKIVSMEFISFPKGEQRVLERFLEEFPLHSYSYNVEKIAS